MFQWLASASRPPSATNIAPTVPLTARALRRRRSARGFEGLIDFIRRQSLTKAALTQPLTLGVRVSKQKGLVYQTAFPNDGPALRVDEQVAADPDLVYGDVVEAVALQCDDLDVAVQLCVQTMDFVPDTIRRRVFEAENADVIAENAKLTAERDAVEAKAKQRIQDMAAQLIRVAAERKVKEGVTAIPPEGAWDEFCARFPFAETDDQQRAIADVLEDLASGRPMDRLICGDVGFGKTEVALRAAFAVAMSGAQVAVIVPVARLTSWNV